MARFSGVGAGKGSKARDVNKAQFDKNYEAIFGVRKKRSGYSQWCMHGKFTVKDGKANERCEICERPRVASPHIDCFGTPRWNQGLGCYTSSIRETERIAKQKGLAPIGNESIDKVFRKEDSGREMIRREISEARLQLRAQLRKEGRA